MQEGKGSLRLFQRSHWEWVSNEMIRKRKERITPYYVYASFEVDEQKNQIARSKYQGTLNHSSIQLHSCFDISRMPFSCVSISSEVVATYVCSASCWGRICTSIVAPGGWYALVRTNLLRTSCSLEKWGGAIPSTASTTESLSCTRESSTDAVVILFANASPTIVLTDWRSAWSTVWRVSRMELLLGWHLKDRSRHVTDFVGIFVLIHYDLNDAGSLRHARDHGVRVRIIWTV